MRITPTYRTAAIAGMWSATGLGLLDTWTHHANFASVGMSNLVWLSGAALFFLVPVFFLVIGARTASFSRTWFLNPQERAEYWIVVKRMIVWFLSAGATGLLVAAITSTVVGQ
jgi:hypothetical protein